MVLDQPEMLKATAGTLLLFAVGVTSVRALFETLPRPGSEARPRGEPTS